MAISGVNNYRDVLFQWQNQQLKNTGASASNSSTSTMLNTLFGGSQSMTSQISSMVELTKYAMDQMGVGQDARVTFSQISRYREQLQSEFNSAVKNGIAQSGIDNVSALSFTLDKDGKITAVGENAQDRKAAQAWLDANPAYGLDLLKTLPADAFESGEIAFNLSSTGKITVKNTTQAQIQAALDKNSDLADKVRAGLKEAGLETGYPLEFVFDADGSLQMKGENSETINSWLKANAELETEVKKQLEQRKVDPSAVFLRLGEKGAPQISVNNADLNEIQARFDKAGDIGAKIAQGLDSLGIDKNVTFSLQVDASGNLKVISDHPDAAKIQQFFDDNPELVKKYRQIETLAGIDDARKAMQVSPSALRKRIQIESMAAWWTDSGSSNSYFGNYSSEGLSLLAGLNLSV